MTTQDGKNFFQENLNPEDLFKAPSNESHITIEGKTFSLKGSEFKKLLNCRHYEEFGFFPSKGKVNSAIEEMDMLAQHYGETKPHFSPVCQAQ